MRRCPSCRFQMLPKSPACPTSVISWSKAFRPSRHAMLAIGIYWQAKLATFIISYLPTNRLQDPSLYIIATQTRTHKSDWIPNCNVDEVMLVTKLILWGLIIFGQKPAKSTFILVFARLRNAPLIHPHESRLYLVRHACAFPTSPNTVCYFCWVDACGANPFSRHPAGMGSMSSICSTPSFKIFSGVQWADSCRALHLQKGHWRLAPAKTHAACFNKNFKKTSENLFVSHDSKEEGKHLLPKSVGSPLVDRTDRASLGLLAALCDRRALQPKRRQHVARKRQLDLNHIQWVISFQPKVQKYQGTWYS